MEPVSSSTITFTKQKVTVIKIHIPFAIQLRFQSYKSIISKLQSLHEKLDFTETNNTNFLKKPLRCHEITFIHSIHRHQPVTHSSHYTIATNKALLGANYTFIITHLQMVSLIAPKRSHHLLHAPFKKHETATYRLSRIRGRKIAVKI